MATLTHAEIDKFLSESKWLRRLAQRLVVGDDAHDVVQDTWAEFAAHPPRHADAPRGWLAQVARNAVRMRIRGGTRRAAREAAVEPVQPPRDPEELLARTRLFRELARLVEALEDPYRSVVLLHFFEGVSLAEIARCTDTPAGTVRWRLKVALARLRRALDDAHRGDREAWLSAFAPLCSMPERASDAATIAAAHGTAATITAIVATAVLVAGAGAAVLQVRRVPLESKIEAETSSRAGSADAPVERVHGAADRSDEPARPNKSPASAAVRPNLPRRSTSDRPLFTESAEHADALAAVRAARLERLRQADIGDDAVQAAARDTRLLGDIEEMMMLEDAAIIAHACAEVSAPRTREMLHADIVFIGEADIGVVIESVVMDPPADGDDSGFTTCLTESLFMLSLAPPPIGGGSQHLRLFFDTDGEDIIVGNATDSED